MNPHLIMRCKRGHELTGDNLYVRTNGSRYCRACQFELDSRRDRLSTIRASRPQCRKTHCQRGHEMTPDNVTIDRDGSRRCKTCRRMTRNAAAKLQKKNVYNTAANTVASRPSDELIAETRRRAAAPRDLTAIIFNDPPEGYSALDRRQSI